MSMLILRQGRSDGMTTFFKFSTNFIRHISTSITSWKKIFCMRIAHNQYASHTKTWPNAYVYLWRLGQKTSEKGQKWRSFRHNSSPNESIMTGPISKFLEFEVMAACKVWTKSNGWNAESPYLPLLLGSYPLRHIFWARQRVPSRPRRLLVGYRPDHLDNGWAPLKDRALVEMIGARQRANGLSSVAPKFDKRLTHWAYEKFACSRWEKNPLGW